MAGWNDRMSVKWDTVFSRKIAGHDFRSSGVPRQRDKMMIEFYKISRLDCNGYRAEIGDVRV